MKISSRLRPLSRLDDFFPYDRTQLTPSQGLEQTRSATKRILHKTDIRLLPVLALLYVIAFLDRSNIGNAKAADMNKDLKLTGSQYNMALTVSVSA